MNRTFVVILLTLCAGLAASANEDKESAPTSSLRLQVKEVGSKRAEKDHWKTSYGSYDKDVTRKKTIEYHVQNFNKLPAPQLRVTAIWVMANKDKSRLEASNFRTADFNLPPGQNKEGRFESPEVIENTLHFAALGETYTSGLHPEGYIIALSYKGELIRSYSYGSTETLKSAIRAGWVEEALKQGKEPEQAAAKANPEDQARREAAAKAAAIEQARQEKLVIYIRNPKLAQQHAVALLPAIGEAGTPENKEFVDRAVRYRQEKPDFFNEPDWPVRLAEEIKNDHLRASQ
ncbi:MAG TPA: hypothetical protein VNQ90_04735 [Chthoniobacteraceae bacterium]|nr:hypothetical protein [Chthoniobacteraceae bacterium]